MRYLSIGMALAYSAVCGLNTYANENNAKTALKKHVEGKTAHEQKLVDVGAQTVTSGFAPTGLELRVDSDSSSISANFKSDRDMHQPGLYHTRRLALKFKAPLNKSTKTGSFITNGALTNNFSANLTWSSKKSRFADQKTGERIDQLMHDLILKESEDCREKALEDNKDLASCDSDTAFTKKTMSQKTSLDLAKRYSDQGLSTLDGLNENEVNNLFTALLDDRANAPLWYYGVDAGLGYKQFNFRNPLDAAKLDQDQFSYSFKGFAGVATSNRDFYLGGGVNHAVKYKESSKKTRCGTADENGFQECLTEAFAPPVKDVDSSIFALARLQSNKIKPMPDLAVEVKVVYDFEDNIFGIAAPLYLFQAQDGNLRGGVRLDWDEDSDVKIGIFMGSSFDLLANG